MDKINIIKNKLDNIKETHPNIYNLWKTYFYKKLETLESIILEIEDILYKIENDNLIDLSQDNIISMVLFMSCFNNDVDMT